MISSSAGGTCDQGTKEPAWAKIGGYKLSGSIVQLIEKGARDGKKKKHQEGEDLS